MKRDNKKLDQQAVAAIFIEYSLEQKGWLFYSPDYKPSIFWSNLAKFIESKCWTDHTKWKLMSIQPPPTIMSEEDTEDLGYSEENLYDERDQEPLNEYIDMESTVDMEEDQNPESLTGNSFFGLTATSTREERNLDPTV
ncbi:uncharacterized protein UBRO_20899 [Ustilago bromivora]|uniref:Retroviral polymerase SH3-like domain-containing protein n=1 Tax=Ustilago bromivora TaxID=307758 RepID=A0A1K0GBE6_9BASI|nr:uncharacterized protein UBRO_20899 [Ustilago bromivora]